MATHFFTKLLLNNRHIYGTQLSCLCDLIMGGKEYILCLILQGVPENCLRFVFTDWDEVRRETERETDLWQVLTEVSALTALISGSTAPLC